MTKSRKLIVATLLLAGGYGVALFLGGLVERVVPGVDSNASHTENRGLFTILRDVIPRREAAAGTGQLVPEVDFAARNAKGEVLTPLQSLDHPTWLATTSSSSEPTKAITRPESVAAPSQSVSYPITPKAAEEIAVGESPPPKARITNVVAATQAATSRDASPWDRWPRWDPSVMSPGGSSAAAPATFHNAEANRPLAVPAAFDRVDIVHNDRSPTERGVFAAPVTGRTHIVVDGDSLAKLADRYLDDDELDDEIYRLNRDVLNSPDLLPIGVELRIPDGRMAESTRTFAASHTVDAMRPNAPAGMVPVEWSPRAFDDEPRAQLLRPIPAGRSD